MTNITKDQLIKELSREIVQVIVPEELPLFRVQSEAYFKNTEKIPITKSNKDGILGFGVGEAAVLLTPYILPIMNVVVIFLTDEVKKALKDEASALIAKTVKGLFKKNLPSTNLEEENVTKIVLTNEQISQLREIVLIRARQLNIDESKSDILANAIIGSLL